MKLQVMPLLWVQRELYDIPLGRARFERYLDVMIGGSGDIVLPLRVMNPMRCSARPAAAEARDVPGPICYKEIAAGNARAPRDAEGIREGACWTW